MSAPIEDVADLPGKKLLDQAGNAIGKVKQIYAMDDGFPMWVAVDASPGIFGGRIVFVPLARLKDEDGQLHVPYSRQRIVDAPTVDGSDGISPECDRMLRDFYGIDTGDQELRTDNKSYAARVPDEAGAAERIDDPAELDTPDADTRTEESIERLHDPGSSEARKVTASDVSHDDQEVADESSG